MQESIFQSRRTVPQRVEEYTKKNPNALNIFIIEVNEIAEIGDMLEIISTAFAYGYMKGQKAKKGGAV